MDVGSWRVELGLECDMEHALLSRSILKKQHHEGTTCSGKGSARFILDLYKKSSSVQGPTQAETKIIGFAAELRHKVADIL